MIKINTSLKNLTEKIYLFDIIFNEFLGLEYQIGKIISDEIYEIYLPNGNKIIISDHFWKKCDEDLGYLAVTFLPTKVIFFKNEFTFENDIPILYGNANVRCINDEIFCDIDIFSTIFFYLTRWEEFISKDKDIYGRFKLVNSYSYQNNIVKRPIVDEYVEMLWKMIIRLDDSVKRIRKSYKPVITHDVDMILRLLNFKMFSKSVARNIFKTKNYTNAIRDCFVYPLNKINTSFDLGNTYEFLMDISESINQKSFFFFINSKKTNYDPGFSLNTKFASNVFRTIKDRGHIIGIHPSFYSVENPELWKIEYDHLSAIVGQKLNCGRQHYLRFSAPYTWQLWENNGLLRDFTLGFAEMEGFRCGTSHEYSVYNFLTRKKLNLKEIPLILMEVSLTEYQNIRNPDIFIDRLIKIVEIVKRYNGNFVFLWHNFAFDNKFYTFKKYIEIINNIK